MATNKQAAKTETQVEPKTEEVVDVSNMVEVAAPPTLEEQVKKIDEQLADTTLFPLVRDALTRVRTQVLRQRIHALQAEVRVLRALMPAKQKRVKKA